jgi:RNA polymerase sigma-70 factor (ECF subfamily)
MIRRSVATWLKRVDPSTAATAERHRFVVGELVAAARERDPAPIARVLHRGVALTVDGGGVVPEPLVPLHGRSRVGAYLAGVLFDDGTDAAAEAVNALPGLVLRRENRVVGVLSIRLTSGRVAEAWLVTNPDKLAHWNHRR